MSVSIYQCWKLFRLKYRDVPSWKKSPTKQKEWLSELATLESDFLNEEVSKALPFGTASGIRMTIIFYQAVAMNEGTQAINAMSDYMEKFNRIGYQISQDSNKPSGAHSVRHQHESSAAVHA